MKIKSSGFASTDNNNSNLIISSVTADKIIVTGATLVTETAGTGHTLENVGQVAITATNNETCLRNMIVGNHITGAWNSGKIDISGAGNTNLAWGNIDENGLIDLQIAGGTKITKHLSATATLDFGAPLAVPGSVDLTITVPGASLGDTVTVGAPVTAGSDYILTAFVSAADMVTVRWTQIAGVAADPDGAGGAYRADVWKH